MCIRNKKFILNSYCSKCIESETKENQGIKMLELVDGQGVCSIHGVVIDDLSSFSHIITISENENKDGDPLSFEEFEQIINQD